MRNVPRGLFGIGLDPRTWPQIFGGSCTRSGLAADHHDSVLLDGTAS